MIGLSLTRTVRQAQAERDEARHYAEREHDRADHAERLLSGFRASNAVLVAQNADLRAQLDAQPVGTASGRFAKRGAA